MFGASDRADRFTKLQLLGVFSLSARVAVPRGQVHHLGAVLGPPLSDFVVDNQPQMTHPNKHNDAE